MEWLFIFFNLVITHILIRIQKKILKNPTLYIYKLKKKKNYKKKEKRNKLVGGRPPIIEPKVAATTLELLPEVAATILEAHRGWPTTLEAYQGWPVPPSIALEVVQPPLAPHNCWSITSMFG